jgi:hypothetical protein
MEGTEIKSVTRHILWPIIAAWTVLVCSPDLYAATEEEGTLWLRADRINMLISLVIVSGVILYCIYSATRGRPPFLRKIPGIQAVEEAVGRATEMGRSILFCPGVQDLNDMQTLAGINILGHVARKAAEYDTVIQVPNISALVMSACQDVVHQACLSAGRPDAYRSDRVFFLTADQFGFAAGVNGLMVREKPATVFMMGAFYAEALLLAETGNSIGAIQIAGTAESSQIPFFLASCDYTLIGEELFAASAYLSNEPRLLGSLRGQDICKLCVMAVMLLGAAVEILVRYQKLPECFSVLTWLSTL